MTRRWMLDTNIVSHAVRGNTRVMDRLSATAPGECCVSIITLAELRYGVAKVNSERLRRQLDGFISVAPAMAFDRPAELAYATIRNALEARGTPIGPNDTLIAAHAIALDLTLVTANTGEFARVPGLRVENWLD